MSNPAKKYRSKFFRVAVEGDTTDGRVIEGSWITQMANSYDQNLYGARINMEHIRGIIPDSPFKAYGDVLALKAEEITIDGKKKLALYAQLEPTDSLVAMVNNDKQKIYTSIEVSPNFAKTGGAYLVGLAVTDSPASLGTEKLSFAAKHPEGKVFEDRKLHPDNLFTASSEASIVLEDVGAQQPDASATLLNTISTFIEKLTGKTPAAPPVPAPAPEAVPDTAAFGALLTDISGHLKAQGEQFAALRSDMDKAKAEHSALVERLSKTADASQSARPPVSGNANATAMTDC